MREDIVKTLSKIEVEVLRVLHDKSLSEEELAKLANLPIDSVRRALAWLKEKNLAHVEEINKESYVLTRKGREPLQRGLPEEILIKTLLGLKGSAKLNELMKKCDLNQSEFNAALGKAKRYNLLYIEDGIAKLTDIAEEYMKESKEHKLLEAIANNKSFEKDFTFNDFLKRGLIEKRSVIVRYAKANETTKKALEMLKKVKGRMLKLDTSVELKLMGKKHPYLRFLDEVRSKLIAMGFKEMKNPLIVEEFYNFDVLYQPQNHPARDWTSTYRLKKPAYGKLPERKIVDAIKAVHETGAKANSRGWRYRWSIDIAKRLMPAAHGTAHSARQLVEGIEIPGKYFTIARCFRPDVIDRTHLIEFNQLEGIIAGDLSFRHLLSVLEQFAIEFAGAEKVKFKPDYYPFTEPSVELSAKHPERGWLEFGGAGLFRPEILRPLGIKCNVLAWGLGIDRIAMFKLGIDDVRELFSTKLDWLREMPIVRF